MLIRQKPVIQAWRFAKNFYDLRSKFFSPGRMPEIRHFSYRPEMPQIGIHPVGR